MLTHKTRTIWGKVAPLGCNCRGCFQFSRHPKSPWEAANSDQHHHSHITNGCLVMAHIPEIPPSLLSSMALKFPGIHPLGNLRPRQQFPMCQEPQLSMEVSRKTQKFFTGRLFGTPFPKPGQLST